MNTTTELSQLPIPNIPGVELIKIEVFAIPHPYCITSKHVTYAADHNHGMLTQDAIEQAEKNGAKCGNRGCNLKHSEHEQNKALVIKVPQNHDLNAIEGLHAYLLSIKDICTELNITGFAFPTAQQL